jgi:hypothetical protein
MLFKPVLIQSSSYNGDITSVAFHEMQARFHRTLMIGRYLIPILFTQYDQKQLRISQNKMELFSEFHDTLYAGYSESLSGSTHILIKMHHLWEYTFQSFFEPTKA